jgi:hypothetical protein
MSQDLVSVRETCRVCARPNLTPILSLGNLYISDFLLDSEMSRAFRAPLELVFCDPASGGCGLLQLRHTASHEAMYRNYWYRSGINKTMTDALRDVTEHVESLVRPKAGDFVIDIGANDGTLLRSYTVEGLNRIGFEPARNLGQYNKVGTTKVINDFFNYPAWQKEFGVKKAKAITAIAMFYDLEDPNLFVSDVAKCLDDDGVFIIQMSYLPLMLDTNEVGNICHEHVEYYSLYSIENLLARNGIEVIDVELNDINGGSFRLYMRHKGSGLTAPIGGTVRLNALREYEKKLGLADKDTYQAFVKRVEDIRDKTVSFIKKEVAAGKKVYVYGASTKGNTVLQYFKLDSTLIKAAAERNPDKWEKKTVGTNIPIISEEQARKEMPDYFLVLPWHFLKEFREREREFFMRGGKFIVPFPEFKIIEG